MISAGVAVVCHAQRRIGIEVVVHRVSPRQSKGCEGGVPAGQRLISRQLAWFGFLLTDGQSARALPFWVIPVQATGPAAGEERQPAAGPPRAGQ